VFGIPAKLPYVALGQWLSSKLRYCTGRARTGMFCWRAVSKHVDIFLKTDSLEDSLCAPG
jgi:hypothetical protein